MDESPPQSAESTLDARLSRLERLVQQQAASSTEMVQSLSSKVDMLMRFLMAPLPAETPQCVSPPSSGPPTPGVSQTNQQTTGTLSTQLQQPDSTDHAEASAWTQPAPGAQHLRTEEGPAVRMAGGHSSSHSSLSSSFVQIPDSRNSLQPSTLSSSSWHAGDEDIISNTPVEPPVPNQAKPPVVLSSTHQELNFYTGEGHDQFSADFADEDLFASRLPAGQRPEAQQEGSQRVSNEAGASTQRNEEEDWITNSPASSTSDTSTRSFPGQTAAQASQGTAGNTTCHTRPSGSLAGSKPVQEGTPAEQVEANTQASSAGPSPEAGNPSQSGARVQRSVQFTADANAPTRESRRRPRPSDRNSLEAAADKILRGLKVSRTGIFRESVIRALTEEQPSPRAVTAQTVLCLDCSPSIGTEGLSAMKTAALAFVSGIEEVAERHGLDENLGVVTFGPSTEVVQHLTIDYQAVREAIESVELGGRSPLFEALLVSVAAFTDRGGCLSIAHVHTIRPRMIIFTDGIATQTNHSEGVENFDTTPTHRRVTLVQFVTEIERHPGTPSPLIWVPIGSADKDFLKNLAKIGRGKFVEPEDIGKECHYFHFHSMVGRAFVCVKDSDPKNQDEESLRALVDAIFGEVKEIDKDELVRTLKEKLTTKEEEQIPATDFRRYLELPGLPPLGTRMVRAKGWRWGDQDGGGLVGTVINHCSKDKDWLYVQWDHGGNNRYCHLPGGEGHVTETKSPRILREGEAIAVGVRVKRGPDWNQGNSDGGPGNIGVVIRARADGKIRVRWPNGEFKTFVWGEDGKRCLELVDKEEDLMSRHVYQETRSAPVAEVPDDSSGRRKVVVWQWSTTGKENEWNSYDEDTKTRLEKQFLARPQSTCVIDRAGESRRVSFKKMEEWKISDPSSVNFVRRLLEDAED